MNEIKDLEIVALSTDGGLIAKNPSPIGGTWAFCGVNAKGQIVLENSGIVLAPPLKLVTNNHTKQIAIVKALEAMPEGWSGQISSNSKVSLGRVFQGWQENNLPPNISARTTAALRRLGEVKPISEHSDHCEQLCKLESKKFLADSGKNVMTGEKCGGVKK
ncbi:MAG TPA: hypothetical protein PKY82_34970 [Pyrinomonadaceae bacterium]|nr:hypothetical protein [Pyrinomonadaceae bacterium]